ncbi:MAG: hypothetical protein ABSC92_05820 [Rhizomicrobium sp.]|jgi:hypothetical protein
MLIKTLVAVTFFVALSTSAQAAKVCAWMIETESPDDERMLVLWLQSDSDIDFFYQIGGRGIVTPGNTGNAPNDGTFSLLARKADSPWKYGQTFEPPGKIDVTIELHKMPADIFSDAPKPLLAAFSFNRDVPKSEKRPPATLAKKQCATISNH